MTEREVTIWPIVLLLSGSYGTAQAPASSPDNARTECVTAGTPGRLLAGHTFRNPIGSGLELRLTWDGLSAWDMTVGPVGSRQDYLWVVSPPFRTAPHRQIGQGYNVTAVQSARMSPRSLRFVTSAQRYQEAAELADRAQRDATGSITVADIERKEKGPLQLWITGYGTTRPATR